MVKEIYIIEGYKCEICFVDKVDGKVLMKKASFFMEISEMENISGRFIGIESFFFFFLNEVVCFCFYLGLFDSISYYY